MNLGFYFLTFRSLNEHHHPLSMNNLPALLGLISFPLTLNAATSSFSDSEFATPWAFTTPTNGTIGSPGAGGGGSASFTVAASGGSPGPYAQLRLDIGSNNRIVEAFFAAPGATHNPSTQGAISTIDFSFDRRRGSSSSSGNAQAYGPALQQGGISYYFYHADSDTTWQTVADNGLSEDDFFPYSGHGLTGSDPNYRPDFSAGGSAIQLGYYRGNSTVGGSAFVIGDLDNWSATVHHTGIPEPSSLILLGAGLLPLIRRKRS
ncbi:MAG: PEP-CTERM sorting domain-containing protein [Verrucomicrobiaceae bacterium]